MVFVTMSENILFVTGGGIVLALGSMWSYTVHDGGWEFHVVKYKVFRGKLSWF
jgi:hypothetical protein